jgi:hypothetical protein
MLKNGIVKTLALLAVIGVAACGTDTAEVPADQTPAAEEPALAPEAQPADVEQDTIIIEGDVVEVREGEEVETTY